MSTVFAIGGLNVSVLMIGGAFALLLWTALALVYAGMYRKTVWGKDLYGTHNGKFVNAVGFGLLPAFAVFRLFTEGTDFAFGRVSRTGWLRDTLLTAENAEGQCVYVVNRIEAIGLLLLFALLVLWLALRRERIPNNGDVLWVALTELGGFCLLTDILYEPEQVRIGEIPVLLAAGAFLILLALIVWTVVNAKKKKNTALMVACWVVYLVAMAAIYLRERTDLLGTESLTLAAIRAGAGLLAVKAALCAGRVGRTR